MRQRVRSNQSRGLVTTWIHSAYAKLGLAGFPLQIYVMLVISLLMSVGRNLAFPYLAMYLTGERLNGGLGVDPSLVGVMIMLGGFAYTFSLVAAGSLCDRFGRKKMLTASIIPQVILTVGYAYASTFYEFLLLYVPMGIIGALYDPAYSAMVADLVQPGRREEVYGLSYMIANVGTVISPLVGGVIATFVGYSILFTLAAVFMTVCATIILVIIKESYSMKESKEATVAQLAGIFRDKIFVVFCFTGALTNVVYSQLYGLLSVYVQHVGLEPYIFGVLFSVNGAMVVALQIPIRKVSVKVGSTKAFVIAQMLMAVGFAQFMLSRDFTHFLFGVVLVTLGEITYFPASSGFVAYLSPSDMRGRYMALSGMFFGVGGSVGSLVAFRLYGFLPSKGLVWGILGIVGLATMPGYLYLLKVSGQVRAHPPRNV